MDILPIATQSASQTVFFTSTGIEKAFTLIGLATVAILSLFGLFVIVKSAIKNNVSMKKIG